ncbi:MAG: sporulation protein [Bacteroidota bacterium]
MSFLSKVKQILGIGTVSVKLDVIPQVHLSSGEIAGTIIIRGKSNQKVKSIEVKLEEESISGKGDLAKSSFFTIGSWRNNELFMIQTNEERKISFQFTFHLQQSATDKLAHPGGVDGGLGKLAYMLSSNRSVFTLKAIVDIEGAKLDPQDFITIQMIA